MSLVTSWDSLDTGGLTNVVTGDVLVATAYSCSITLSDVPGLPTVITLPQQTRQVRLWTPDESIRLALDDTPVSLGRSADPIIPASTFTLGDIVLPGVWQVFVIPDDTLTHTLTLISGGVRPTVLLVALVE